MAKTYYWEITTMEVELSADGLTDIVKKVNWNYIVKDTEIPSITEYIFGSTDIPSPNPESFTQYGQLTKEMVIDWLKTQLNEENLKQEVDEKLYKVMNPTTETKKIPWELIYIPPTAAVEVTSTEEEIQNLKDQGQALLNEIEHLKTKYQQIITDIENLAN